ncbi:MAG: phage portal protein [Planctomycetes bacterium]|nr:phage portal protein [Planctomycetota bacterium]
MAPGAHALRRKTAVRRHLAMVEERERNLRSLPSGALPPNRRPAALRSIRAGEVNRLNQHFKGSYVSLDEDLKGNWGRIVARARELALNESYMRRFLQMADTNVIGRAGLQLQSNAKQQDGEPDDKDQEMLEAAWKRWAKRQFCDIRGKRTFKDIQSTFTRSFLRDGEGLIRIIKGAPNEYRFALQPMDPMLLDQNLSGQAPYGVSKNKIVMGVELDKWTRPVAYWILQPDRTSETIVLGGRHYLRLPADEIIHEFLMIERPDQNRGVPAGVAAVLRLEMLQGAEEAELTASRLSACKMGAYTSDGTTAYTGDGENEDGSLVEEAVPGMFLKLPAGVGLESFDPKHPNGSFVDFTKLMLMGAGASLGVSYPSFANDPTGTSYSTLRHFALEEREYWRALQDFVRDALCERVFGEWLKQALLTSKVNAPPRKFDKFMDVSWYGRGFPWIDPLKEQKSIESAILNTQTKTRTEVLAEAGKDLEEHFQTLAREERLAAKHGIQLNTLPPAKQTDPKEGEDE